MITKGHKTCKYAIPLHWMAWMLKKVYNDGSSHRIDAIRHRRMTEVERHPHQYVQLIEEVSSTMLVHLISTNFRSDPLSHGDY